MWQTFVKNATKIRAQQVIDNIAKTSTSAYELQRLIFGLRHIPALKVENVQEVHNATPSI